MYAEGWQSWSPATWHSATATGRVPGETWEHLMRFRPGRPVTAEGVQGEGLVVVDPGTGAPARCYGTTDPVAVPTIRTTVVADRVLVRSSGPVDVTQHPDGESALVAYGDILAVTVPRQLPPPTVWCSWYRYFEEVTADDVLEAVRDLDANGLGVDVVQVDDGWSPGLGEGLRPAERFGSLAGVVDEVRASGRRAGIWLAPFVVGADTTLAHEHPDWLVGPAGRNWGQLLVGLDLTHPGVQELLVDALRGLLDLGVDYLKLDFLYAGAVPGRRREDVDAVAAYRAGLGLVRDVVGPDVYLVGCGAPILPSLGPRRRHAGLPGHLPRGRRGRLDRAAGADATGRPGVAAGPAVGERPRLRRGATVLLAAGAVGAGRPSPGRAALVLGPPGRPRPVGAGHGP